jgi:hypothetical protein
MTVLDRDLALLDQSLPHNYDAPESTQQKVVKFIESTRPLIISFNWKDSSFEPWVPDDLSNNDPSVTSFLDGLSIPLLNGFPRLLMHELGQWVGKDTQLAATIRRIFGPHHT